MTSLGAIWMIARTELRRRGPQLLMLGVLTGLVVSIVGGTATLTRRTATAHDRLEKASGVADLQVTYFAGDPDLAERIASVPGVVAAWTGRGMVGRLEDRPDVAYIGIIGEQRGAPGLYTPVVVSGRPFDPGAGNEAVLDERTARRWGIRVGDRLRLRMLTAEDFVNFDTGFGTPGGALVDLTITGLTRMAGEDAQQMPLTVSPAAMRRLEPVTTTVMLRLAPGSETLQEAASALRRIADSLPPVPMAGEFPALQITRPATDGDARIAATQRVLVTGLVVFGAVVGVAGLAAAGQALARHHGAGVGDQRIEAALGLPGPGRTAARVLAALPAIGVAGLVAAAGPAVAGTFEPLGPLAGLEPRPGYIWHPALSAATGAAGAAAMLVLVAVTAARAGRRPVRFGRPMLSGGGSVGGGSVGGGSAGVLRLGPPGLGRARGSRPAPTPGLGRPLTVMSRPGPPWLWAGIAFAFGWGRRGSASARRPAVGSAALAIAGLVTAATIAGGVQRLVDEPARYGWNADIEVVDARPQIVNRLAKDPRVAAVTMADQSTVLIKNDNGTPVGPGTGPGDAGPGAIGRGDADPGDEVTAYAIYHQVPSVGWTMLEGRAPRSPDEIAVGPRIARRYDLEIGDHLYVPKKYGTRAHLRVVGIGLGPVLGGERLGESVLLEPDVLAQAQLTEPWRVALVRAVDKVDPVNLAAALSREYELDMGIMPAEVANLGGIGRLPDILQTVLGLLAVAAAGHAMGVTWRRRRHELAVLRTLGFTPSQTAAVPLTTSCVNALLAVAIGVPVGIATARLVWWEIATATGVATDLAVPVGLLVTLPAAAIAVGLLTGALPAWRAVRTHPAAVLRGE